MQDVFPTFLDVDPMHDFSMGNLPYGVFLSSNSEAHICVAIGERVLDLHVLSANGLFPVELFRNVFLAPTLNPFLHLGPVSWMQARNTIRRLLGWEKPNLTDYPDLVQHALPERKGLHMVLPVEIPDYTDFYASEEHARNVGTIFRGAESALNPNWRHLPVGYHGRSSSIVVSGTDVVRPTGQILVSGSKTPTFAPSRKLDFELEVGWIVGTGNRLGSRVPVDKAMDHIFGMVLVNDWSARDIQQWEYVPLGPFLGKSFQTSISPWIVPMEALHNARCPAPNQIPEPLPYLIERDRFQADIDLEVFIRQASNSAYHRICASNVRHLYWSPAQMVAHHTSNGCNLRPGDLLASGTISAPRTDGKASLLELTENGESPIQLGDVTRRFLEDGDEVRITGKANIDASGVGFGDVTGRIVPARELGNR